MSPLAPQVPRAPRLGQRHPAHSLPSQEPGGAGGGRRAPPAHSPGGEPSENPAAPAAPSSVPAGEGRGCPGRCWEGEGWERWRHGGEDVGLQGLTVENKKLNFRVIG